MENSQITYLGPSKISDNSLEMLYTIMAIIDYTDPEYKVTVSCTDEKTLIRILPSKEEFKQELIDNLLWVNKHLPVKIEFSKSLKIQKSVSFELKTKNNLVGSK